MDIDTRKQKILEMLNSKGKVKVSELSEMFNISDVTIRTDLADLESKGFLSRVHGGAVSSYKPYYNMNFGQRMDTNHELKKRIAEKVASMVEENDILMFNAGTTTLLVFRLLPMNMNLSIVTNSISIALEAAANPNFNVVLLGGAVNTKYQFTYGDDANSQIARYHADKLILSVDGISPGGTLSTYYNSEVEIDCRMYERANTRIIAADYTKIGRSAFAEIVDVSPDDFIVTNDCAPEDDIACLREKISNVILV